MPVTEIQKITIVIPVYNEEQNIAPLTARLMQVINSATSYRFEILFVDDGSCDNSIAEIENQIGKGLPVGYIKLSRNFGHQCALEAGLSMATGDAIITMDGDLQHPPEEILPMVAEFINGADVVQMQRSNAGQDFKGKLSVSFYTFFKYISDVPLVPNAADFRLLSRKVVNEIIKMPGKGKLLRALIPNIGFNQIHLVYVQPERKFGTPAYSFFDSYELALDTIFKFSRFPAHFTSVTGALLLLLGGVLYVLHGLHVIPDNRHTFFVPLFLMLSGGIFMATGIICWYLYFILEQVRHDPGFVIQKVVLPEPQQS